MNDPHSSITEYDLHAYIDGQLDPQRRKLVDSYLEKNPKEKRRLEQLQELNRMLQDQINTPERPVSSATDRDAKRIKPFYAVAASLVCGVIGLGIGLSLNRNQQVDIRPQLSLAQHAAYAHMVYTPEVRHPVEVKAEKEQHLVKWLSKRIGHTIHAPVLKKHRYELVGGRLLPGEGKAAAQFMYQNNDGNRLTLYIKENTEDSANTAFRYVVQNELSVFYWIDGTLGYALSGNLEKDELLAIATTIYESLEQLRSP